jgi:Leucine-rich repeat (LRR) protein
MVVLGIAARWLGEPVFKARRQAKAVAAIRAAGGTVYYDEKTTIPAWMTTFFGPDFGKPVDHITFAKGKKLDAELLPELPALRTLELDDSEFTDADMPAVARCANLVYLSLDGTEITDTGLKYLAGLTRLEELGLSQTKVTDAGFVHLEGLTNLRSLTLEHTALTDEGLKHFQAMKQLEFLQYTGTQVTAKGKQFLQKLWPNLNVIIF